MGGRQKFLSEMGKKGHKSVKMASWLSFRDLQGLVPLNRWPAMRKWDMDFLEREYGEIKLKCGEDDDGNKVHALLNTSQHYPQTLTWGCVELTPCPVLTGQDPAQALSPVSEVTEG